MAYLLRPTLLLAILLGSACAPAPQPDPHPPNVVLIVADDLGWTDLGAYGSRFYETPNIDRLAREGLRFTSAYANPNCAPTRAALLTGRYSPRTGIYTVGSGARGREEFRKMVAADNVTNLALDEVTFGEVFKQAGYATAHMGKWHMGKDQYLPPNQGFDLNIGGNDSGSPRGGYFRPFDNPQLPDGPEGQHLADLLAAEAAKFIASNQDRPFLLYLPFYSVHSPIQAKPDLVEKYRNKPAVEGHSHAEYAAMVETLDTAVGVVLDTIDELDLGDDTVVVFYSDNGGVGGYTRAGIDTNLEVTDNAPLRGGKGMLYEGGVRVPLIVRRRELTPAGSTTDVPVMCVDLLPTLLDIAGLDPPAGLEIDGTSFYGLLGSPQETPEPRPPIYWHFPGYLEGRAEVGAWRTTPGGAIRDGNLKLIEFFETGEIELYDLAADISEERNLVETAPDEARRLQQRLREWRERLEAPMPTPKPD